MMRGHSEFGRRLDSHSIEEALAAIRDERANARPERLRAEVPHL